MRPRRALPAALAVIAVALASGCGAAAPQLEAVRAPEPYLPPIAPEAAAPVAPTTVAPKAAPAKPKPKPKAAPAAEAEGAPSDAEVARELAQAFEGGGDADVVDAATVGADGLATVPLTAPSKVRAMILAGNQVARKPYVYGGGHGGGPEGVFSDSAYDCSGSLSYALASAGFIDSPMASGGLAGFGKPGPGKWVSIYANDGHAFMVVAGLRFDTSGRAERDTRWQAAGRPTGGFTVRHPPGL